MTGPSRKIHTGSRSHVNTHHGNCVEYQTSTEIPATCIVCCPCDTGGSGKESPSFAWPSGEVASTCSNISYHHNWSHSKNTTEIWIHYHIHPQQKEALILKFSLLLDGQLWDLEIIDLSQNWSWQIILRQTKVVFKRFSVILHIPGTGTCSWDFGWSLRMASGWQWYSACFPHSTPGVWYAIQTHTTVPVCENSKAKPVTETTYSFMCFLRYNSNVHVHLHRNMRTGHVGYSCTLAGGLEFISVSPWWQSVARLHSRVELLKHSRGGFTHADQKTLKSSSQNSFTVGCCMTKFGHETTGQDRTDPEYNPLFPHTYTPLHNTCSKDPISSWVFVTRLRTGRIMLAGVQKRNSPGYCPPFSGGTSPISSEGGT